MANLNKVMLIGRLTRDPEIRTFANGGKVANIGLAVNNRKKNQQTGQRSPPPSPGARSLSRTGPDPLGEEQAAKPPDRMGRRIDPQEQALQADRRRPRQQDRPHRLGRSQQKPGLRAEPGIKISFERESIPPKGTKRAKKR